MPTEPEKTESIIEQATAVFDQFGEYGFLILDSLYLIIVGMAIIFLLHKIAARFLYPKVKYTRLARVIVGTLYVLVLAITALLALKKIGFDVEAVGQIAIISILIGAVVIFFLVPFLPKLPFVLGHMVEIKGVLGHVEAISSFHTTIRTFDGSLVFIPNAIVMASQIMNFHYTPSRRIELQFKITVDSELEYAKELIIRLMSEDERVLDDPSPPSIFLVGADATGVDMAAYCWVLNEHWLAARSDLWLRAMDTLQQETRVTLALAEQKVYLDRLDESPK